MTTDSPSELERLRRLVAEREQQLDALLRMRGEQLLDSLKSAHESNADQSSLTEVDGTVGTYRYGAMLDRLGFEATQALRLARPLTLAMVRLSGMDAINQRRGYREGDEAIAGVARFIASQLPFLPHPRPALMGRWSGVRFLIAFPAAGLVQAEHSCWALMRSVERRPTIDRVGLHVGLAPLVGDVAGLLAAATHACDRAQQNGAASSIVGGSGESGIFARE